MADQEQPRRVWEGLRANAAACPTTLAILAATGLFGVIGFLVWCRPHLEDGAFLMLLFAVAAWNLLKVPLASHSTPASRCAGWLLLVASAMAILTAAVLSRGLPDGQRELLPLLGKNAALLFLAAAAITRQDGFPAALQCLPLLVLAILVLPLYELLLLEFSYPP